MEKITDQGKDREITYQLPPWAKQCQQLPVKRDLDGEKQKERLGQHCHPVLFQAQFHSPACPATLSLLKYTFRGITDFADGLSSGLKWIKSLTIPCLPCPFL